MNTRQIHYAVLLAEVGSFSQVAQQLGISQPALSKQIIALEGEMGVKLFNRSGTPVSLTPAGEFFVRRAKALLQEEDQLLKTMERYRTGQNGKLIIGISPFRSQYLIPGVIKQLRQEFPGLKVVLSEDSSARLQKGILEGVYDFAILNLPVDEARLEATPLMQDELVVAVHENLLPIGVLQGARPGEAVDFAAFAHLPFITLSKGQEMRRLFEQLCAKACIEPAAEVEVVNISTAWAMVQAGVGATLMPRQFIRQGTEGGVLLFPIRLDTFVRTPAIVTLRGQYVSSFAKRAMELLYQSAGEPNDPSC